MAILHVRSGWISEEVDGTMLSALLDTWARRAENHGPCISALTFSYELTGFTTRAFVLE